VAQQRQDYLTLVTEYGTRYLVTAPNFQVNDCLGVLRLLTADQTAHLYALHLLKRSRTDYLALSPATRFPSKGYEGNIDHYGQNKLAGWALIAGLEAQRGQAFVLLADDTYLWQVPTCKTQRPDVSVYYQQADGLYDGSGYEVYLGAYALPPSTYRLGILVENEGHQAATWTQRVYVVR
jgi:hypothetical protein